MIAPSTRRGLIAGAAASLCAGPALAATDELAAIEARVGGRLGVAALDLRSGAKLAHRADERFPMCSTFKAMAVSAALANVESGDERLDRFVRYGEADLLGNAPITKVHVKKGGMAFGDLCAAAITVSDNTAANLILASIGGPAGWTRFVRRIGDKTSRLDRTEMSLNTSIPGDPRDTTTPAAMAGDLRAVLLGGMLGPITSDLLKSGCWPARPVSPGCAPACRRTGRSPTRPAPASTAPPTTSRSSGRRRARSWSPAI